LVTGSSYYVAIAPNDGYGNGSTGTSNTITIQSTSSNTGKGVGILNPESVYYGVANNAPIPVKTSTPQGLTML
jgi:hypothetical protein